MAFLLKCAALSLCAFIVASGSVRAADVAVDGDWTIVYAKHPYENRGIERTLRSVALALSESIEEATGAKLDVVPADKAPKGPGRRLFLGDAFAGTAGLLPDEFKGYDWGTEEKDGDIYFFGKDCTGSYPASPTGCVVPSALAAVRFMRDEMGVQFLMPGRIGREVPKLARLAVPKGFRRRGTVTAEFQSGRHYDTPYNLANYDFGAGVFHSYGGHTYPAACPRAKYFKDHPEYFAMNAKGERAWGDSDGCQAYCISNPEFQKLVYDEMLRRYDAGALACQLGQHDGGDVCHCAPCEAMYGTGTNWCEKLWLFHVDIARRILKDRPGKLVHIMCYGATANPPKTFKAFPDNVLIEICRYGEEDMRKWDGYTVPHGFTYYIYNWSWYPLLGFTPKRSIAGLVDQVKRFHRYGMKGIYRCGFGEMFGMEGPAYWVFNHLVEDPNTDVRAALSAYYRGAFGPAAEPMRRFYEDLEKPLAEVEKLNSTKASDLVESTIRRPKRRDPIRALSTVYTPERVARMDAALRKAQETKGLSAKQRRRLQLVRTEWTYVRNIGTIAYDYRKFAEYPTKAGCDKVLKGVKTRNEIIARLFPEGKVRRVNDWPEINLFGDPPLEQFKENGRLGAPIKEPLNWDADQMMKYRIVPNERMTPEERRAEMKKANLRPLTGFRPYPSDVNKAGAFFKPYADSTGFTFGQGTNTHVRVRMRLGEKEGLLPGRTYRVSWLWRWEHVNARWSWHGFYFSAECAPRTPEEKGYRQAPERPLHFGTSPGWIRESLVLPVCDRPGFASDFIFRFWGCSDGIAEVRDVTLEDVTDPPTEVVLELQPKPDNPRNSEGSFARLKDGSLLFAWSRFRQAGAKWDNGEADIACRRSADGGRTWSGTDEILVRNTAMNVMSASFLRLQDGRLALFYLEKRSARIHGVRMCVSTDEAKTWGEAVDVTGTMPEGQYVLNNDRVIQLKGGRILVPLAYHPPKPPDGGFSPAARLLCVRSDDGGRTWRAGEAVDVFADDGTRIVTQEPGVIELKDGRVMMWARTNGGAQYAGCSSDGGITWGSFAPMGLEGPLSPATIRRLKSGELLAIWNDHRGHPEYGSDRVPLSIALSADEGRTWSASVPIEDDRENSFCYTALVETGDDLLLAYCMKRVRKLDTTRMRRVSGRVIDGLRRKE